MNQNTLKVMDSQSASLLKLIDSLKEEHCMAVNLNKVLIQKLYALSMSMTPDS